MRKYLLRFLKTEKKQTTFCYCPICRHDLCGSESFISDNKQGVTYKCTTCGAKSLWDFDTYQVPVLTKHQTLTKTMKAKHA